MATKKSVVWDYFTKASENKVKCNICQACLSHHGGNTSSLLKHLQGVHKKEVPGSSSSSKQKPLTEFGFTPGRPCPGTRKEKIDQLISAVVAENNLPFTFTESSSFRNLLNFIEPNYKPMCAKTIKKRIEEEAKNLKEKIKQNLDKSYYISLTTDCWTSINNDSFMAITTSYIDEDWKLMSPVLETRYLSERHYAEYLKEELSLVINEWNVKDRVFAIVHDNASNIKNVASAISENYIDIGCGAHTLQLCIADAMGTKKTSTHPIAKAVNAASRLVAHFSHSTVANNELKKRQKSMSMSEEEGNEEAQTYCLIQYVRTRWNSIADMFERLLKLRWPICAVLGDRSVTKYSDAKTLDLTNEQWGLIENITPVLLSLKKANTLLCGEKFVTVSAMWPVMRVLVDFHLKVSEEDSVLVKQFKNDLKTNIIQRFDLEAVIDVSVPVPLIATALDPRHKNLPFLKDDKKDVVFSKLSQLAESDKTETGAGDPDTQSPSPKKQKRHNTDTDYDYFAAYDSYASATSASEETEGISDIQKEIKIYRSLETLDRNEDPLNWWKGHKEKLFHLSKLAKKYLAIPATSVASERHFSAAGRTLSKIRNRLLPQTTDALLFVAENSEFSI